jgi:hypothetical protein
LWKRSTENGATRNVKAAEKEHQQFLLDAFGPPIDETTAKMLLPHAIMMRDAYNSNVAEINAIAERRLTDSDAIFRQLDYSQARLRAIKKSGFFAAIYQRHDTGEITVAFRGEQRQSNKAIGRVNDITNTDVRFRLAADIAWYVKTKCPTAQLSLIGHASCGAIAAYAGEQTGIFKIITFNAQNYSTFTRTVNPKWVNVGWVDTRVSH